MLATDLAPPTSGDLGRCNDARARQFWDPERLVSGALLDPQGPRRKGVAWDYVAVYSPGAVWGDTLPKPSFEGGPLVRVVQGLSAAIRDGS